MKLIINYSDLDTDPCPDYKEALRSKKRFDALAEIAKRREYDDEVSADLCWLMRHCAKARTEEIFSLFVALKSIDFIAEIHSLMALDDFKQDYVMDEYLKHEPDVERVIDFVILKRFNLTQNAIDYILSRFSDYKYLTEKVDLILQWEATKTERENRINKLNKLTAEMIEYEKRRNN
jgi:glutamyl/glutaminyl-tRNA synthetase